jgi:cytochrome c biogenesis protein CcdA
MQGWIDLRSTLHMHSYVLGTSIGALLLLALLALMAKRMSSLMQHNRLVQFIPGGVLFVLGVGAFIKYFMIDAG